MGENEIGTTKFLLRVTLYSTAFLLFGIAGVGTVALVDYLKRKSKDKESKEV